MQRVLRRFGAYPSAAPPKFQHHVAHREGLSDSMLAVVVLLAVIAVLLVYGVVFVSRDYLSPLAIFSYYGALAFFVRPALLVTGLDDFYSPQLLFRDWLGALRRALLVYIVSYASTLAGYLVLARLAQRTSLLLPRMSVPFSLQRMLAVATLVAIAGVAVFATRMVGRSEVGTVMADSRLGDTSRFLTLVPQFGSLFLSVVALACFVGKRMLAMWYALALYLGLSAVNIAFGDRSSVVVPLVLVALAWHYAGGRLPKKTLALVALVVVVASSALGQMRNLLLHAHGEIENVNVDVEELFEERSGLGRQLTDGLNLQVFDYFLVVLNDYEYGGARAGEDFLLGASSIVPRAIWAGKPQAVTPGQWFRARYTPSGTAGRPYTAQGVYWLNFGMIGVCVGYLLAGFVYRLLWEFLLRNRTIFGGAFVATAVLSVCLNGISPIFPVQVAQSLLPFVLSVMLMTIRTTNISPAPERALRAVATGQNGQNGEQAEPPRLT